VKLESLFGFYAFTLSVVLNLYSTMVDLSDVTKYPKISDNDTDYNLAVRRSSFIGQRIKTSTIRLANAGFISLKQGDLVQCVHCDIVIGRWKRGDQPSQVHRRLSPNCLFHLDHDIPPASIPTPGACRTWPCSGSHVGGDICPDNPNRISTPPPPAQPVIKRAKLEQVSVEVMSSEEKIEAMSVEELRKIVTEYYDLIVCKICLEGRNEMVFKPCGHNICCRKCSHKLRNCPICRVEITGRGRVFLV